MADLPWWQVFDDPTLQALVREALINNLDVRVAVARVEEARARAGIAKSFLYPQVNGVASYAIRQASNAPADGQSEDTTHQSGTYGFQLSWELDVFGRVQASERGGKRAVSRERAGAAAACSSRSWATSDVQLLPAA